MKRFLAIPRLLSGFAGLSAAVTDQPCRDWLSLFNFWGAASAQSMAIVTPEWKYIHWYHGEGMKPTEEL